MASKNGGSAKAWSDIRAHLGAVCARRPSLAMADGLSPKGAKTLRTILAAAHRVFVRDGHAGLSMRKVAQEAGVAVGNMSYYFDTKRALLSATLSEALADYADAHLRQLAAPATSPLAILLEVVVFYVANGRETHRLFFQMWGYAASDEEAKTLIRELYRPIGRFIHFLVREARPDASEARAREIVLQLFSLEEGIKLFIGFGPDDNIALKTAERHARRLAERLILAE